MIGAVGHFGHNVHRIEVLAHHRLRQPGTELDSLVLAREAHFRQQPPQFLHCQQRFFFARVAEHQRDRRRFIAERQIVGPYVCRK